MFSYVIGQGLELRLLEYRHAAELFELSDKSRDHLRPWMPWIDGTKTVEDTKEFIRISLEEFSKGDAIVTGVFYNGCIVGILSFHNMDRTNRSATIDYWIGVEHQRKGLMTRACEAFIDYGFKELDLNRIVIWAAKDNIRSIAIPERLGFTKEGLNRQARWLNGHFIDVIVYSMLRSEWK
jgi:ribosomal-protein-serine acetyltransferase